jgi:protein-tyrosine-phosphatase
MPVNQHQPAPPQWTLRNLVPDSWLRERDTFLRLGPKAGSIYVRLRLLDLAGVRSLGARQVAAGASSFLFVCFGNLMRSAMAEALFRKSLSDANLRGIRVQSAGLHAVPGNEAHPWALTASREIGLPLTHHRAQMVTPELVAQADTIFAMDFENKAELLARYPESGQKVRMLGAYAEGASRGREIPDPYFGDLEATRRCLAVLQSCIRNLTANWLAASRQHESTDPAA